MSFQNTGPQEALELYSQLAEALRNNDQAGITLLLQNPSCVEVAYEIIADENAISSANASACTTLCGELIKGAEQVHGASGGLIVIGALALNSALDAEQFAELAAALPSYTSVAVANEYRVCLYSAERSDVRVLSHCSASLAERSMQKDPQSVEQLAALYGTGFSGLLTAYTERRNTSSDEITVKDLAQSVEDVRHALDMVTLIYVKDNVSLQDAVMRVRDLPQTGATVAGQVAGQLTIQLSSNELVDLAEALSS
jgi:hypothetical protein